MSRQPAPPNTTEAQQERDEQMRAFLTHLLSNYQDIDSIGVVIAYKFIPGDKEVKIAKTSLAPNGWFDQMIKTLADDEPPQIITDG